MHQQIFWSDRTVLYFNCESGCTVTVTCVKTLGNVLKKRWLLPYVKFFLSFKERGRFKQGLHFARLPQHTVKEKKELELCKKVI